MEDVEQMSSSPVWLKTHGLKECKLCLSQIIKQISFRHSEGSKLLVVVTHINQTKHHMSYHTLNKRFIDISLIVIRVVSHQIMSSL